MLKGLKQDLATEEAMVINEDKLDKALQIAQKQLANIESSQLQVSSAHRLTRPARNLTDQVNTFPRARAASRNEEYDDKFVFKQIGTGNKRWVPPKTKISAFESNRIQPSFTSPKPINLDKKEPQIQNQKRSESVGRQHQTPQNLNSKTQRFDNTQSLPPKHYAGL